MRMREVGNLFKVNLNNYVKFKLNDNGIVILKEYIDGLGMTDRMVISDVAKLDDDGYRYMQLWSFMSVFGKHLMIGNKPFVEDNNLYFEYKMKE